MSAPSQGHDYRNYTASRMYTTRLKGKPSPTDVISNTTTRVCTRPKKAAPCHRQTHNTGPPNRQTAHLDSPKPRDLTHQVGERFQTVLRATLPHLVPCCRLILRLSLSHKLSQGHQEKHGEEDLATEQQTCSHPRNVHSD